jgi:hypothetical protein
LSRFRHVPPNQPVVAEGTDEPQGGIDVVSGGVVESGTKVWLIRFESLQRCPGIVSADL